MDSLFRGRVLREHVHGFGVCVTNADRSTITILMRRLSALIRRQRPSPVMSHVRLLLPLKYSGLHGHGLLVDGCKGPQIADHEETAK
jgi:hypothetical protein